MASKNRLMVQLLVLVVSALALSGCGLIFGSGDADAAATQEAVDRVVVPTFTATPEGNAPAATATVSFVEAPVVAPDAAASAESVPEQAASTEGAGEAVSTSVFADLTPSSAVASSSTAIASVVASAPVTPTVAVTPTPAAKARLTVTQQGINVRTGPGTSYGVGGTANTGDAFDIIGKNQAGDWWQVCCVAGEPVWVFNALATVENVANVPVAAAPAAPVAAAPVAAAPAPVAEAPAAAYTPAAAEPAPAPVDDPCANIGGDGCKFRLAGGPSFGANGGGEIRLMLSFVHSGVDGGQPQGSYFVVVLKDGENIGVPDSVRSVDPTGGGHQQSGLGRFNYDYKIGASSLPGGNIQGNYQIWVLDGNGERDSPTFSFSVPEGQGEVWMEFDQG